MKRVLLAAVAAAFPFVAVAQNAAPDLIVHHGKIFTADPSHRWAEAVAIRGNRIVAVGTNAEITALAGDATKRVDAGGRVVVPGFNDAHTHQGPRPEGFALSLDNDPTRELVSAALAGAGDETPGDLWIFGTIGPKFLADPSVTPQTLDKMSGRRKVVLTSFTGHGKIFSTAAMDALRIRETSADPAGGWYERDAKPSPDRKDVRVRRLERGAATGRQRFRRRRHRPAQGLLRSGARLRHHLNPEHVDAAADALRKNRASRSRAHPHPHDPFSDDGKRSGDGGSRSAGVVARRAPAVDHQRSEMDPRRNAGGAGRRAPPAVPGRRREHGEAQLLPRRDQGHPEGRRSTRTNRRSCTSPATAQRPWCSTPCALLDRPRSGARNVCASNMATDCRPTSSRWRKNLASSSSSTRRTSALARYIRPAVTCRSSRC